MYDNKAFFTGGLSQGIDLYYEQFLGKKTAMELLFLDGYREAVKVFGAENVGFAPFPIFAKGGLADAIQIDTNPFAITSWSKHPKEAAKVIDFMTNKENQHLVFKIMGEMCANKEVVDVPKDPDIKRIFDLIYKKSTIYSYEYLPSSVWEAVLRETTLYLLGEKSKEAVAQAFDKKAAEWRQELGIK